MKMWIKNRFTQDPAAWFKFISVVLIGAGIGYFYYQYFGCRGTCPLTNNSNITTGLGAFMGLNFGIDFIKKRKK
jgi:F0F1-type ATP synthase assembly protein I